MSDEEKSPPRVGAIGHVDHGKTTLTAAIAFAGLTDPALVALLSAEAAKHGVEIVAYPAEEATTPEPYLYPAPPMTTADYGPPYGDNRAARRAAKRRK